MKCEYSMPQSHDVHPMLIVLQSSRSAEWYVENAQRLSSHRTYPNTDRLQAIISRGRYAGKKVVIVQPQDNGSKKHPFPHAIVAGIERYPSQITRRMSKTRQNKRSKVKPFIKVVNYNHLMPTRYTLELEGLKGVVTNETFTEVTQREEAKKTVKKALEERYVSGKNRWFFTPLRTYYGRKSEDIGMGMDRLTMGQDSDSVRGLARRKMVCIQAL